MRLKNLVDIKKKYQKKSINIFLRCDLNVTDNDLSRIDLSVPTIQKLLQFNFVDKVIICSHLGRPKGPENNLSLIHNVLPELEKKIDNNIEFLNYDDDLNFSNFYSSSNRLFLLENIRFFAGEENNDKNLSSSLASLCDVFVNDAFGTSHRKHSSVYGISSLIDSYAGFLLENEYKILERLSSSSKKNSVLILGGAKIEDKSGILNNLVDKVDKIIIGGGMISNFLQNKLSDDLTKIFDNNRDKFYVPEDLLVSENLSPDSKTKIINSDEYIGSLKILDIGTKSLNSISKIINNMQIALWNGSMGIFEWEHCSIGTRGLLDILVSNKNLKTFSGGGSTIEAINRFSNKSSFEYVSSGGGAFLEMLEKGVLPGMENILINE